MAGIEPVSQKERTLGGWDFFLLWSGAAVSLAEIWAGGLVAPLGLSLGLAAILIGHLVGNTPFALAGWMGSRWGIPAMVSVRPAFGLRGSCFAAGLNVLQLIGWTAVMLIVCGGAAEVISRRYGFSHPTLWVILSGAVTTLWALAGSRLWKWIERISVGALLLLCVAMTWLLFRSHGWEKLSLVPRGGGLSFMAGLDLVMAMPISWLPLVSDYSRFARRTGTSFLGTWWGYFLISSWMFLLGLAGSLAVPSPDPSGILMGLMVDSGWAVPALLIVLFSTFTTTFLDIYSTALSAMTMTSRIRERTGILLGGVLGTAGAVAFPALLDYEHFLLFIGAMFCPLFGVVLVDTFWIRKGVLDLKGLYDKGGVYWYQSGFNPPAIVAWALGFAVYLGFSPMLAGKVLGIPWAFPWDMGSSLPGMVSAGLIYGLSVSRRKGK
jgi:nucleobase:cation symporter-1, NCS1 family